MFVQLVISALSMTSIGLAYWPHRDLRFWGAVLGLSSQPFWFYMVMSEHLYGIAPLTLVYTTMYFVAFRAHRGKA